MLTAIVGELFLGETFGALDHDEPPKYLEDVDYSFLLAGIRGSFPVVYEIMIRLPVPSLRHFLAAGDRLYEVSLLNV